MKVRESRPQGLARELQRLSLAEPASLPTPYPLVRMPIAVAPFRGVEGITSKHVGRGAILTPMMRSQLMAVAMVALTVLPDATPSDCRCATAGYGAAVASLRDVLRTYEACVGESRGHSQCSAEFDELDGAHRDFEDAVAEYRRACPLAPHEPR